MLWFTSWLDNREYKRGHVSSSFGFVLTHLELNAVAVPLVSHVGVTHWHYAALIVGTLALHDLGRSSQSGREYWLVVDLEKAMSI